jgi:hypothetical protein
MHSQFGARNFRRAKARARRREDMPAIRRDGTQHHCHYVNAPYNGVCASLRRESGVPVAPVHFPRPLWACGAEHGWPSFHCLILRADSLRSFMLERCQGLANVFRVLTLSAAKRFLHGHDMFLTIETGTLRILREEFPW